MKEIMPQEIEVWEILPALRREFAKALISEHSFSQKETSGVLGITEAAVSQYVKSKRAKDIRFSSIILKKISQSAKDIVSKKTNFLNEVQKITKSDEVKKLVCQIHQQKNSNLSKKCQICFG